MGDFDRRCAREQVTVEREEAMPPELADHRLQRHRVDVHRDQFGGRDTSPPPVVVLADRHQAQEQLLAGGSLVGTEPFVEVVGAPAQRAAHAAHRAVRGDREHIAVAVVEQLGEGVLEDREGPRLADHVGQQLGHERRLERRAPPRRGRLGRRLELVGRQRHHVDDARPHAGTELGVVQRVVVAVGAQREHDRQPAVRVVDRRHDVGEEAPPHFVVADDEEQLLELVDDEEQTRGLVGEQPERGSQQARRAVAQLGVEAVGRVERRTQQRRFELGERMRTGDHRRERPVL